MFLYKKFVRWLLFIINKHKYLEFRSYKCLFTLDQITEIIFLGKVIQTIRWSELEKINRVNY